MPVTDIDAIPCIGVVLAGGLSTRMGRDKAMLRWRGQPLIEHQLIVLRESGVADACVSGHRPDYHGITDALPQAGPLGGLAGIAAVLKGTVDLLIIPVDMPLLSPPLLQRLRTAHPQARCLRYAGHVLPMRLHLDTTCRTHLATLLSAHQARQRSLHALQEAVGTEEIILTAEEQVQLTDCNTEASWNEVTG